MTDPGRGPKVVWQIAGAGLQLCRPAARDGLESTPVSRTPFSHPEANIVVGSDGYFEVYPPVPRSNGDRPAYRGHLAELGAGIRGANDRLAVRPGSAALADAVRAWSAAHGAAAVRGELGRGRDGSQAADAAPVRQKRVPPDAVPAEPA